MNASKNDQQYLIHIVDDEMIFRRLLSEILNDPKFILSESSSGKQCIDYLQRHRVDIIVLDVRMPDIDGYETCKQLRSKPSTAKTPIIFMTAAEKPDEVKAGYAAGGSDYIIKPFKPSVVQLRIFNMLDGQVDTKRRSEIENNPPDGLSI